MKLHADADWLNTNSQLLINLLSTNLMTPVVNQTPQLQVKLNLRIPLAHAWQKLRLFPRKIYSIMNTFFPPLCGTLCAGCVKHFAEATEHFTHAVYQFVVIRKMASSECILPGANKMAVGGCKIVTIGWMRENIPPCCCTCIPCTQNGVCSVVVTSFIFLFG
jgi:hypothetical protein